jgi:hypothetical protein
MVGTTTFSPAAEWPVVIIASSFGVGALLLAILIRRVIKKTGGTAWLGDSAPSSAKWGFESWALHLTGIGGILGTVLGAVALPEAPTQIDKESVVALSLLFGGSVVVAPFLYEAITRWPKVPIGNTEQGTGFIVVMLISCAIVLGGAVGELFTLGLVGWELTGGNARGILCEITLGLLSLLACYYVAVTAYEAAMIEWKPPAEATAIPPAPAAEIARRSSWSLP